MEQFKLKLASAAEVNDAINGFTANNRLDFDLQWDFEEFQSRISEFAERYNKEKQKVVEEIGTKVDGGWKFNPFILEERMKDAGAKEIEFEAKPIVKSAIMGELARKKAKGESVEITGIELRVLKENGVLVEDPAPKDKKKK